MTPEQSMKTFLSEAEMPAPRANLRACSLNDVIVREMPVHWDEAVAVVQELCDLLTGAGSNESPVPELAAILITADGDLKALRDGRSEAGVAAAGRTLHALLSSSANVPVSLRLLATQAISTEAYSSIRAFADALAYFGKPTRTELIRALYERCAARAASPSQARQASAPDSIEKPDEKSAAREKPASRKTSRIVGWSAAVSLIVIVVGIGFWLLSGSTAAASGTPSVPTLVAGAKTALETLAREVRSVVGVGDASAPVANNPVAPVSNAPIENRPTRRANISADPVQPSDAQTIPSRQASAVQTEVGALARDILSHGGSQSQADALVHDGAAKQGTEMLYSDSDVDVTPPVLLYPQLPPPIVSGRHSQPVNTMELIVSEEGRVERVRLIDGPRRMPDMMLLSGAKMWKFEPAVRNGMPVRYRTIVAWMGVP
jgi:hypothetical protein